MWVRKQTDLALGGAGRRTDFGKTKFSPWVGNGVDAESKRPAFGLLGHGRRAVKYASVNCGMFETTAAAKAALHSADKSLVH